jgi:hypothetical protein
MPNAANEIAFPCRRCRYEIRGISLDGRCPECGEPIWRTLAERVDLSAAFIDPATCARTGRLLPLVAAGVIAASVLVGASPAVWPWTIPGGSLDSALGLGDGSSGWVRGATVFWALIGIACGVAAAGLRDGAGTETIDPRSPRTSPPLRRPRILLWGASGLCLGTAVAMGGWVPIPRISGLIAFAATGVLLLAVGLLSERLGPGSRRWRGGGSARQSPWLVAGSLAMAAGLSAVHQVVDGVGRADAATLVALLTGASMLLVAVGGLYLGANLLWIAGDLRRRRPRLERLLAGGDASVDGS